MINTKWRIAAAVLLAAWMGSAPIARAQETAAGEGIGATDSTRFDPPDPIYANVPGSFESSGAHFVIARPLFFVDQSGEQWVAPAQTITDGVSIPRLWMSIIGAPTEANFMKAAILHDAYCAADNRRGASYHARSRRAVNRMFYEALLASGTAPTKARVMYICLGLFGPARWDMIEKAAPTPVGAAAAF